MICDCLQIMETAAEDGGRAWERGELDKVLKELIDGDIFFRYVLEEDYPCNIDHQLLKQYGALTQKLEAGNRTAPLEAARAATSEADMPSGGLVVPRASKPDVNEVLFPTNSLLSFSSNVLMDLALEMTTKVNNSYTLLSSVSS